MSLRALTWAFDVENEGMTSTLKLVLITLANYANAKDETYPRQTTIAKKVCLSRQTVNASLGTLADMGLIRMTSRVHATGAFRSSIYKLLIPGAGDTILEEMQDDEFDVSNKATRRDQQPVSNKATRGVGDDDRDCQPGRQRVSNTPTEGVNDDDTFNRVLEPSLEPEHEPRAARFVLPADSDFPNEDGFGFEAFWKKYPSKTGGKQKPREIWIKIVKAGKVTHAEINAGLDRYLNKDDFREWAMPTTWLNQGRWEDHPKQKARGAPSGRFKRVVAI